MGEDGVRRQLRFSMFLQGFAAVILTAVLVVRLVTFGPDWGTVILIAAVSLIVAAAVYTRRKIKELSTAGNG
jgi:cell division protein FtsW (lipid II flippase)